MVAEFWLDLRLQRHVTNSTEHSRSWETEKLPTFAEPEDCVNTVFRTVRQWSLHWAKLNIKMRYAKQKQESTSKAHTKETTNL